MTSGMFSVGGDAGLDVSERTGTALREVNTSRASAAVGAPFQRGCTPRTHEVGRVTAARHTHRCAEEIGRLVDPLVQRKTVFRSIDIAMRDPPR